MPWRARVVELPGALDRHGQGSPIDDGHQDSPEIAQRRFLGANPPRSSKGLKIGRPGIFIDRSPELAINCNSMPAGGRPERVSPCQTSTPGRWIIGFSG